MSPTFASLHIRNYRIYFAGALLSNIGTWMGRVAQDWLVLVELTDHDATALGLVTALQFAPVVLLAPFAGALADRSASAACSRSRRRASRSPRRCSRSSP